MEGRVFSPPQMHEGAARVGLFNDFIRFGGTIDECYVAAGAENGSATEFCIARRTDHGAQKVYYSTNRSQTLQRRGGFEDFADDFAGGVGVGRHDEEAERAGLAAFAAKADIVFPQAIFENASEG